MGIKYSDEPADSGKHRHKLSHNKTFMAPEPLKEAPQLPEIEIPEAPKQEKKGFFTFGKKKTEEKTAEETPKEELEETAAIRIEEPEFLKGIDIGKHSHAVKIEPELALWLNDGRTVNSLDELRKALKTMSTRTYNQHKSNSDITNWVKDVVGNAELAGKLSKAGNRKEAIKILEESREEAEKQQEPAKEKTQLIKQPEVEIQHALTKAATPQQAAEKTVEEKERELDEQEKLLDAEEDHLNRKRIEIANRRYQIIRERGKLEKEKFDTIVKKHRGAVQEFKSSENEVAMPPLEMEGEYTKEKIEKMLAEARRYLANGDSHSAEQIRKELQSAIEFSTLTPEEARKLEYEILELEADIKLAALV